MVKQQGGGVRGLTKDETALDRSSRTLYRSGIHFRRWSSHTRVVSCLLRPPGDGMRRRLWDISICEGGFGMMPSRCPGARILPKST